MVELNLRKAWANYIGGEEGYCEGKGDCTCAICGGEFFYDDTFNFVVCEGCLDKATTVENGIEFGADDGEQVSVNGAIVGALGEEKINAILVEWCKAHPEECKSGIFAYIRRYNSEFADWLSEEH